MSVVCRLQRKYETPFFDTCTAIFSYNKYIFINTYKCTVRMMNSVADFKIKKSEHLNYLKSEYCAVKID